MRHRKTGLKLNRTASHRDAMFRNMVTSLFKHQRIQTTDAKAKELRRWADRLITLAKRGDLHARRQALAIVREKDVVHKLFEDAPNRFGKTSGGYTRVIKLGRRAGDAAPVSIVELVSPESVPGKSKKKTSPTKEKATVSKKQAPASDLKAEAESVAEAAAEDSKDAADRAVEAEPAEMEKAAEAKDKAIEEHSPAAPDEDPSPEKNK